jgi:hypothetical protein
MTDKIIQLELPLVWWQKPVSTWKDRHHVSSVNRPTEDNALDNIYYAHRAMSGEFGRELNGLERKVYFYELRSYEIHPKWYTELDRMKWVAAMTGMPISAVKDVLYGVKIILKELVQIEDIGIEQRIKDVAIDILKELSAEYEARKHYLAA